MAGPIAVYWGTSSTTRLFGSGIRCTIFKTRGL